MNSTKVRKGRNLLINKFQLYCTIVNWGIHTSAHTGVFTGNNNLVDIIKNNPGAY
jgi:hypothetical protein